MKVSLLAALSAATIVICDSYEITRFTDRAEPKGIELNANKEEFFEFDEQEVELDETEGVLTAVDRRGIERDISVQLTVPLTQAAILAHLKRRPA